MWEGIALAIKWTILGWFAAIALFILYKIVTGGISLEGVVRHKADGSFGFHRLQLLAMTLLFACGYVMFALRQPPGSGMPEISTPILAALLGSQTAYLGGKFFNRGKRE